MKSGNGLKVESAFADVQGLVYDGMGDRSWAVRYESNNVKISAREFPILFKINVKRINDDQAEFSAPDYPTLKVNLTSRQENYKTKTDIFGDSVDSEDIGDEAAAWISKFLGKKARISFNPKNRKLRKPEFRIVLQS